MFSTGLSGVLAWQGLLRRQVLMRRHMVMTKCSGLAGEARVGPNTCNTCSADEAYHMTQHAPADCADAHRAGGRSLSFRHALRRQAAQGGLLGRTNCRLLQPPHRYRGAHGRGGPEAGPLFASLRRDLQNEKSLRKVRETSGRVRTSLGTASTCSPRPAVAVAAPSAVAQ